MTPGAPASTADFIAPGATLGVLGGGQLARMFVQAAQQMGYGTAVLDPDPASPAGLIAHRHIQTDYLDDAGLDRLAGCCAAVTTEFENVPAAALQRLAGQLPVAPAAAAVAICQDRALEKAHFARCGVAAAPHAVIDSAQTLAAVAADLLPGILKTARLGYDGKGQVQVADRASLSAAWASLGQVRCVLEKRLPLLTELSVIVARSRIGTVVELPVQKNLHRGGILCLTEVAADGVSVDLQRRAVEAARRVVATLDYVGVLCVEFFVLDDGSLIANEMAPRPHNSGHYSIDACDLSQFQLQVRAMTGAPLLPPRLHSPCVMLNLLGDLWLHDPDEGTAALAAPNHGNGNGNDDGVRAVDAIAPDWARLLGLPGLHLHLYGKAAPRPGRKMGHLTVTAATPEQARAVAREAAAVLGIAPW